MSASDWVANTTATFFLRSVFSHSRMRAANSAIVEEDPGLVEHQQGRPPVEARLEAVEEVGQHRRDQRLVLHQLLHLEVQHVGRCQLLRRPSSSRP